MKDSLFVTPRRALLLPLVVAALVLVSVSSASASIRTIEGGDVPFYARIEPELVVHTDEWAAIVFYRPPACVPEDFNLLDFFDANAYLCAPPTTDGFMIWACEPGPPDCVPSQSNLRGLGAVPVWLVSWPELATALQDGVLTVPDLEGLDTLLVGTASFYHETLHPTGGAQTPMLAYVARGTVSDGRRFQASITLPEGKPNPTVRIEIR